MQDSDITTVARETSPPPGGRVLVVTARRTWPRRTDGPMSYGPYRPADENDPEAHIFRGED
ncbi:hypothetical protein GCM10009801_38450 [Streptomyces albiaxialis]|uniref:Uncharacterized protein n=1 Tax=Streptomyces albiaxialis TaxID=329523 RepID=A0ABN2W0Z0_9ACTN